MNILPISSNEDSVVKIMAEWKSTTFVIGRVERIDADKGTMEVSYTRFGKLARKNVFINFGTVGYHSGMRVMPKPYDLVILGLDVNDQIFHLGSIMYQYERTVEPEIPTSNLENYLMEHVGPGEFEILVSSGEKGSDHPIPQGKIRGDRDGGIRLIGGDLSEIGLNREDGEFVKNVNTERFIGYKTRIVSGVVKRKQTTTSGPKNIEYAKNGIPILNPGLDPISEYRIKIGQEVDNKGEDSGDPAVELTVSEQVLDENGIPLLDNNLKTVQVVIKTKNGTIFINEDGVISLNGGQLLVPPKQKVARDNDTIRLPIGPQEVDTEHPNLINKSGTNMSSMPILAGMLFTMGAPAQFIPTGSMSLEGLIVEGSSKVLAGD